MDERAAPRFDQFHAKAGSPQGGQFASSSGGSGSGPQAAAAHAAGAAAASASAQGRRAEKERLLAQAHADLARAKVLEAQLHALEKQHAAAVASAKHSAASAKAAKAAGHVIHHHHHVSHHHHHAHHAQTLQQKISGLKTQIHALRQKAAGLQAQAHAIRAAGAVTSPGATERLHEYWVHGEGAAKIRWGEGGDFDRCVLHLGKFIKDPKGYCANAHHAALGIWPATHAAMEHKAGRSAVATTTRERDVTSDQSATRVVRAEFMRMYPLENIEILRTEQVTDGRPGVIVEAYAAVFGQAAEISDQDGHYVEEIDRSAFDTAIEYAARQPGGFASQIKVLYNHGLTVQGTPAPEFQLPIGVPVDIKPESRGLLTRTRYHTDDPFAQRVLDNIRAGSITAQSFVGRLIRSDPQLRRGDQYRPDSTGSLRTVRRLKLGLREYGPVLWPAYSGAEILGVRMSTPGGVLDPDEEPDAQALPPDEGLAFAGDDPLPGEQHSARYHQHALYALRSKEAREKAGLAW